MREVTAGKQHKVHVVEQNDYVWMFEDGFPSFRAPNMIGKDDFDPYPSYAHDEKLFAERVADLEKKIVLPWEVNVYLHSYEFQTRTNAWSGTHYDHYHEGWRDRPEDEEAPIVAAISVCGKRISPMPALSRYLVAHEFGHQVESALQRHHYEGLDSIGDDSIMGEYKRVRGIDTQDRSKTGGTWEASPTEVFACDFRILVMGVETNYWPHPSIPYPRMELKEWWAEKLSEAGVLKSPELPGDRSE